MKKVFQASLLALVSFVFFSCANANSSNGSGSSSGSGGGKDNTTQKSLTTKINENDSAIDFNNAEIKEDAEVNKAKTISNLKMGGKTLTVNVSGVTLKNISDVAIEASKKIGNGDLTIDGSSVEKLTVFGGGSNSINVKNTKIDEVSLEKEAVRLNMEGETQISTVVVTVNNAKIEAAESVKITNVTVEEEVNVVTVSGGTIETIKVAGDDETLPTILITGETTIKAIETVEENVEVKVTVTEEIKEKVELPEDVVPVVVTVENKYIDISKAKSIYKEGDAFDYTNIYYIEEYSDGTLTKKTLTADSCKITGFDSSKEGKCTVTIAVGEVSAVILVTIENPVESDKNLDLEAALLKGIEKVSKDGVIRSELEFAQVLAEAFEEYQNSGLFGDNASSDSRSIVKIPEDKVLNAADAYSQIMDFITDAYNIFNTLHGVGSSFKFDFDHTINLGELTASQWIDIVLDLLEGFDEIRGYGHEGQNLIQIEKGPIPDGYDSYNREYIYDKDTENESSKYYWKKYEYSDPIKIPSNTYLMINTVEEKWLVYQNEETGDIKKIEIIENDCNFNSYDNIVYKYVYEDSGITVSEKNFYDYEEYIDKENGKYGIINTSTQEIIYAPDGYYSYHISSCYDWDAEEDYHTFIWKKQVTVKEIDESEIPEGYEVTTYQEEKKYYGYGYDVEIKEVLGEFDSDKWDSTATKNGVGYFVKEILGEEIDITGWTGSGTPNIYLGYNTEGIPTYYLYNGLDSSFIKTQLKNKVKHFTGKSYDEFTKLVDEIVTIKNFYLDADIDVALSISKMKETKKNGSTEKVGTASAETAINMGIADVNKALNTYLSFFKDMNYDKFDLPVKAITFNGELKADASISYEDLANATTIDSIEFENRSKYDFIFFNNLSKMTDKSSSLNAATEVEIKTAVCTATGKGGIITISVNAETDLKLLLETISGNFIPGEKNGQPTEAQMAAIDEQLKKIGSLKVSVSDGKEETWSTEYTYSDIAAIVNMIMGN